ncbi:DUF6438 domain-containing protein [Blastomonas sp. SL216]|uniref:DUF6438 domain-containing protein n=1 Tax=Blastomonas sp. SL216 TaxID=2995169 RepID=UPI0023779408|nr:DUF6438 domain-containing protein [Blastomonas sp. SL216]
MTMAIVACGPEQKPFPEIDRAKLRIKLERTGCFGSCPRYQVSIDGNGNVIFDTGPTSTEMGFGNGPDYSIETGVRVSGKYHSHISPAKIDALIHQFQSVGFFDLEDEYVSEVTDNPTYVVSIDTGNGKKSVVDYAGEDVGMSPAVTRLEDAIDEAAGTDRWIKGTPEIIPMLKAVGTDFSGVIGLELMDAAAERNDIATMIRLKSRGAPLYIKGGPNPFRSATYAGHNQAALWLLQNGAAAENSAYDSALGDAVSLARHAPFRVLSRDPRLRNIGQRKATELLAIAAANADVRLVRYFLALGANPRGIGEMKGASDPPLFKAANGGLVNDHGFGVGERRKVVAMLLKAGAGTAHTQYGYPQSILWAVDDPTIAEMLINAGANPNFRDDEGEHILFSISDDDVAMVLIAHGADLDAVRPADGMTLGRWARYQGWRRVVDLLNRKGL